jgi:hypothetical protein
MSKSSKMYSSSPSIKKDSEGKAGISKPTPAAADSMATSGNPLPPGEGEMPIHIKQINDMHERHGQEMKDMHKRHEAEHKTLSEDHAKLSGTPGTAIEGTV